MKRWIRSICGALFLLPTIIAFASASEPIPSDFAYGMQVEPPTTSALATMLLPEEIYRRSTRSDLSDIRVFNRRGEIVPHILRVVPDLPAEPLWRELPFFPIPAQAPPGNQGYRVYVRTDAAGAVVEVAGAPAQGAMDGDPSGVGAFLIDTGEQPLDLEALRVEWNSELQSLMAPVSVERSNDLIHWSMAQERATLADIRYGDHHLTQTVIMLGGAPRRYLKLARIDQGPRLPIAKILVKTRPVVSLPERIAIRIEGRAVENRPGAFEYDAGGHFPMDRAALIFEQVNSLAMATLSSRDDPKAQWARNCRGLFYHIEINGLGLMSESLEMAAVVDRYFRLEIDAGRSALGSGKPMLSLSYHPHELLFLTRGERPFTVAFGSSMPMPPSADMRPLLDALGKLNSTEMEVRVASGPITELGGVSRLVQPKAPLPMRRMVLWGVLVIGVALLAAMTLRLARRMRVKPDSAA